MQYRIINRSAVQTLPVEMQELKGFLRVDSAAEEPVITTLLQSAILTAEQETNVSLIEKEYEVHFATTSSALQKNVDQSFVCKLNQCLNVQLPMSNLNSVLEVKIIDGSGVVKTLEAEKDYFVRKVGSEICILGSILLSLSSSKGSVLAVKYKAGFPVNSSYPQDLKLAFMNHTAFLYDNRGGVASVPVGIMSTYFKYKKYYI